MLPDGLSGLSGSIVIIHLIQENLWSCHVLLSYGAPQRDNLATNLSLCEYVDVDSSLDLYYARKRLVYLYITAVGQ